MGRVRVTPKNKVKKNIPITRVGKKQYLKRRFAHVRKVDLAGHHNDLTQKYHEGGMTAEQTYTQLGLTSNPSASRAKQVEKRKRARAQVDNYKGGDPRKRRMRKFEEEDEIAAQNAADKANKIARPVSEREGSVIANLIAAYGVSLKRMVLDHKLNPFQLNERQLQRQIVNYLRWEKAAFPAEFAEAEEKGWFSVEMYADPKLRSSQYYLSSIAAPAPAPAATANGNAQKSGDKNDVSSLTKKANGDKNTTVAEEAKAKAAKKSSPAARPSKTSNSKKKK